LTHASAGQKITAVLRSKMPKNPRVVRTSAGQARLGRRWLIPATLFLLATLMVALILFAIGVLAGVVRF
jgi:hypothetical protein